MAELLKTYFIGQAKVNVDDLVLTTIGREQRESGILALMKGMEHHGFIEGYAPTVCLVQDLPVEQSLDMVLAVGGVKFRVLDGNHRVAAWRRIHDKNKADNPELETMIPVRVHRPMTPSTERIVAAGEQSKTRVPLCRLATRSCSCPHHGHFSVVELLLRIERTICFGAQKSSRATVL